MKEEVNLYEEFLREYMNNYVEASEVECLVDKETFNSDSVCL